MIKIGFIGKEMKIMLISKEEFVDIINRFKDTQDTVDKVILAIKKYINLTIDSRISDCINASSLMICHEDIAVKLLEKIFDDTDILSWWLYDCYYGRDFKIGDLEDNGVKVDLTTPEKLYDYLVECYEKMHKKKE